ncbi:MAG: NADPH-dependent oxidoreductase [Betaproteobacteria bacterium]|nr:NADPH-dependent oxidoreductase [Betaproteobacteria bacterium]
MNAVIDTILNHRTYRDFQPDVVIPEQALAAILACAQQAPSWMNGQHYSIIHVTDTQLRDKIVALQPRNPQIGTCSAFLIFVADLYRAKLASDACDGSFDAASMPDTMFTMTVDTSLAAQNALIAAESLGYGTCPIGGLRLVAPELVALLNLPLYTFPLFGLCIGKPSVEMRIKPRLPQSAVVHQNQYQTQSLAEQLAQYEQTMLDFNEVREKLPFRQKISHYYQQSFAPRNTALLRRQGFLSTFEEE